MPLHISIENLYDLSWKPNDTCNYIVTEFDNYITLTYHDETLLRLFYWNPSEPLLFLVSRMMSSCWAVLVSVFFELLVLSFVDLIDKR